VFSSDEKKVDLVTTHSLRNKNHHKARLSPLFLIDRRNQGILDSRECGGGTCNDGCCHIHGHGLVIVGNGRSPTPCEEQQKLERRATFKRGVPGITSPRSTQNMAAKTYRDQNDITNLLQKNEILLLGHKKRENDVLS